MRNIISLTQCVACRSYHGYYVSEFHFKGYLAGELVKRIILQTEFRFIVKDEYILHLKVLKHENNNLYCSLLRSKNLNDILS